MVLHVLKTFSSAHYARSAGASRTRYGHAPSYGTVAPVPDHFGRANRDWRGHRGTGVRKFDFF
jgi:hypothetical protein